MTEKPEAMTQELKPCPDLFMVFDVESIGLHGEGFAVGYVVVDREGKELACDLIACNPLRASGEPKNLAWVQENVPAMEYGAFSPYEVRQAFWGAWENWKAQGAALVADCCWPVEARFLAACVDDANITREWEGPYPLHDLASVLMAYGRDPLAINERLPAELPAHNPLRDARQSARLLVEAIAAWNRRAPEASGDAEAMLPVAWEDEKGELHRSPRFHFLGLVDEHCGSRDHIWSGTSLEEACEAWKQFVARGSKDVCLTGWGSGTIARHREMEERLGSPEPRGTFACPICGQDTPHEHTGEQIRRHRELSAWIQDQNEKQWEAIKARVARLEERYPERKPLYDASTLRRLAAENAALKTELEIERMRLAACGCIALADTLDSAKAARSMHPDYRSASADDVARRVDECIALRAENAALRAASGNAPTAPSVDLELDCRAALLWVVWHHQGASSDVGQAVRFALGMGQYDRLTEKQVNEAKRWEALRAASAQPKESDDGPR